MERRKDGEMERRRDGGLGGQGEEGRGMEHNQNKQYKRNEDSPFYMTTTRHTLCITRRMSTIGYESGRECGIPGRVSC